MAERVRHNPVRLVARLDVKAPNLVKGIQMEGLRKLGDPNAFARRYYQQGIDEILYVDIVASLYERNSLLEIIRHVTSEVFVPITVGGGLRTIDDVAAALRAGADKVAINTAALKRPALIGEVARRFGAQCMVLSIQAKRRPGGGPPAWEAYYDNGREHSGRDVLEWAREGVRLGAGEILLTSVDREGTGGGFDRELLRAVAAEAGVPVVAGGGFGQPEHLVEAVADGADAVAMAQALHYGKVGIGALRAFARERGVPLRELAA